LLENKRMTDANVSGGQRKKYIIILSIALTIVFGVFFSVKFFIGKINDVSTRTQELIADQENNIKMLAGLHGIREEYNEIKPHISMLDEFFKEDQIVGLVTLLEKLAADTENEITIEVFEDDKVPARSAKVASKKEKIIDFPEDQLVRIGVNLSGRYDRMVEFAQRLKGVGFYNDIESIDISAQKTQRVVRKVRPSSVFEKTEDAEGDTEGGEEEEEKIELGIDTELIVVFYLENKKLKSE
jgi:hypothetical protein